MKTSFPRPSGGFALARLFHGRPMGFWCNCRHTTEEEADRCVTANTASMRAAGINISEAEMEAILQKSAKPRLAAEIAERPNIGEGDEA